VSYVSVTMPDTPRHTGRAIPRWGSSAPSDGELQSVFSQITSSPEVVTTELRNTHVSRAREAGMDPAMELWVDDRTMPVRIRMAGRLDSSTSPSLLALLDQLLAEGVRQFLMDAGELDIGDAWGATALTACQRRARDAGGSLIWEGVELGPRAPNGGRQ
jgi:hypothetical protein